MDVLSYVMGQKSAGTGGGGGGTEPFIVNFDLNAERSDKTFDEIKEAALSGKTVYLKIENLDSEETDYYALGSINELPDTNAMEFHTLPLVEDPSTGYLISPPA